MREGREWRELARCFHEWQSCLGTSRVEVDRDIPFNHHSFDQASRLLRPSSTLSSQHHSLQNRFRVFLKLLVSRHPQVSMTE